MLAGGRSGKNKKYVLDRIRGDKVGWFDGDPCHDTKSGRAEAPLTDPPGSQEGRCWRGETLKVLMSRIGTLIQLIASQIPELQGIESRSEAMVTCYPGNGSRYIKHSDNPHRNGRKLTVLYYLNHGWTKDDGGELRIYDNDNATVKDDVAPIGDRVVVFFSDTRVPHEVLPANTERFAITHWFYDHTERAEAEAGTANAGLGSRVGFDADLLIEQQRIEAEIAKFEEASGETARVKPAEIPQVPQGSGTGGGSGAETEPQQHKSKSKKKKKKKKKAKDSGLVSPPDDTEGQRTGTKSPDKDEPNEVVAAARAEATAARAVSNTAVATAEQAQSALKLAEDEAKATAAAASNAQKAAADAIAKADATAAARDAAEAIRVRAAAVAAQAVLKCQQAGAFAAQKEALASTAEEEEAMRRREAAAASAAAAERARRAAEAKLASAAPLAQPQPRPEPNAVEQDAAPQMPPLFGTIGPASSLNSAGPCTAPPGQPKTKAAHKTEAGRLVAPVEPRWEMKQPANMPGTTVLTAWLPGLTTARDIVLDVNTTWATLDTADQSVLAYHLRVEFEIPIDIDRVGARFKKKAGVFVLTLPHAGAQR